MPGDDPDTDRDATVVPDDTDVASDDTDAVSDSADAVSADRRREIIRATADEIRGDSSESRQVAAILYRVSDLYDPDEDTSPEEIYLNVRNIVQVKTQGGLRPDEDQ